MIEGLKPYPAYQELGLLEGLRVPAHWPVKRAKYFLREVDERSQTGSEELLSVSHKTGVTPRSQKNVSMFLAETNVGYKVCRPGDVAVNTMWAWMAAVGVARESGIVSPSYGVYRPLTSTHFLQPFLDELLRLPAYRSEYAARSVGITDSRLRLYPDAFLKIPLPLPPPDEQAAIVRFLDHADRRIRRFIRAKQQVIKLLEEQKQAIIHQAVTRGLDPGVAFKPSGIPWLGDVPTHWEVWQMGHFARLGNGSTPSRSTPAYWAGGHYPWLNSGVVNRQRVTQSDQYVTDTALRECHLPIVPAGSLIVALTGQGKTRGKAAILEIDATINQHLAYITLSRDVATSGYLRLALEGLYTQLRAISEDAGSTKGALTCGSLRHFRVAVPPLEEQQTLLIAVEKETATIASAIKQVEAQLAALREYRTRLIADVVTGQLDVRAAAAALPDEAPEADDLDTEAAPDDDEAEAPDDEVNA